MKHAIAPLSSLPLLACGPPRPTIAESVTDPAFVNGLAALHPVTQAIAVVGIILVALGVVAAFVLVFRGWPSTGNTQ